MPLFSRSHHEPTPAQAAPVQTQTQNRASTSSVDSSQRRGFFSRRRSSSPDTRMADGTRNSLDNHNNVNNGHGHHSGGLLHRNHEDPSISSARERVMQAEMAEKDADRALMQARASVKEARNHVKALEREAAEEARLAKIKQKQASDISKRAKPLGRHGF